MDKDKQTIEQFFTKLTESIFKKMNEDGMAFAGFGDNAFSDPYGSDDIQNTSMEDYDVPQIGEDFSSVDEVEQAFANGDIDEYDAARELAYFTGNMEWNDAMALVNEWAREYGMNENKMFKNKQKMDENKCNGSCIRKVGNKWRVVSGKTGKLWDAEYDTREDAEAGLRGYFFQKESKNKTTSKTIKEAIRPMVEKYLKEWETPKNLYKGGDNDFLNDLPPDTAGLSRGGEDTKAKREFVKMAEAVKSFYIDFWGGMGYSLGRYSKRYDVLKKPIRDLMTGIGEVYRDIHNEHYFNKPQENDGEIEEATTIGSVGAFSYDAPAFSDAATTNHHKVSESQLKNAIKPLVEKILKESEASMEKARRYAEKMARQKQMASQQGSIDKLRAELGIPEDEEWTLEELLQLKKIEDQDNAWKSRKVDLGWDTSGSTLDVPSVGFNPM